MSDQATRRLLRRQAVEAQAERRRARAVREQRIESLVVELLVEVQRRDDAEARAAALVTRLVGGELLSGADVLAWCAGRLTARDLTRLRRMAGAFHRPDSETLDRSSDEEGAPA